MTDEHFMKLAIQKAKEGIRKRQTPFGACIVKNGKVLACVHNVVWKTTDITAHAEVHAIRTACRKVKKIDLSGATIYSTCEPCPMCFSAIHWARISRIVYGVGIKDAAKIGFNELAIPDRRLKELGKSPLKVEGFFLYKENLELFQSWAKRKDKRAY